MKTKDFTSMTYALALNALWEFFDNNPNYVLQRYEPISNGIRAYYAVND